MFGEAIGLDIDLAGRGIVENRGGRGCGRVNPERRVEDPDAIGQVLPDEAVGQGGSGLHEEVGDPPRVQVLQHVGQAQAAGGIGGDGSDLRAKGLKVAETLWQRAVGFGRAVNEEGELPGRSEQLRLVCETKQRVEDNTQEWPCALDIAGGQEGIVGQRGAHADEDGVATGAKLVDDAE